MLLDCPLFKGAGNPEFLLPCKHRQQSNAALQAGGQPLRTADSLLGACGVPLNMSSILSPLGCWKEATMRVQGVTPESHTTGLCSLHQFLNCCSFSLYLGVSPRKSVECRKQTQRRCALPDNSGPSPRPWKLRAAGGAAAGQLRSGAGG